MSLALLWGLAQVSFWEKNGSKIYPDSARLKPDHRLRPSLPISVGKGLSATISRE